jgi:transposase
MPVGLPFSSRTSSLSPDGGEKMSKHAVRGGDVSGLRERFAQLRKKARARTGKVFPFVVIQEAGLDGFWIDRLLRKEGIESHVVDPASAGRGHEAAQRQNAPPATPEAARGLLRALVVHAQQLSSSTSRAFVTSAAHHFW